MCEAVDVVVPPVSHLALFRLLVDAGVRFISEKPFCRSWPEACHVAAHAASRRVRGAYLENWIFDPAVVSLHTLAASGRIGVTQRVSVRIPNAGPALYPEQTRWRASAREGGGALLDWGSHAAGLAWFLIGLDGVLLSTHALDVRRSRPRAIVGGAFTPVDVEDFARFELAFRTADARFVVANIDASWGQPWMWSPGYTYEAVRIDGSQGSAAIVVTNTPQGRSYSLLIDGGQSTEPIDLGLLKDQDPTAAALDNALQGLNSEAGPGRESSLDFGVDVQGILGAARLSAHEDTPIAPAQFESWCASIADGAAPPDTRWERALAALAW
jgi:predicted dehydrogenase